MGTGDGWGRRCRRSVVIGCLAIYASVAIHILDGRAGCSSWSGFLRRSPNRGRWSSRISCWRPGPDARSRGAGAVDRRADLVGVGRDSRKLDHRVGLGASGSASVGDRGSSSPLLGLSRRWRQRNGARLRRMERWCSRSPRSSSVLWTTWRSGRRRTSAASSRSVSVSIIVGLLIGAVKGRIQMSGSVGHPSVPDHSVS